MKMITAIVHKEDTRAVCAALVRAHFSVTRLSTTGGFLMAGNTTLLIGTEDERIEELVGILKKYCSTHKKVVASTESFGRGLQRDGVAQKITVGGATYFVLNVDEMGKL